MNFYEVWRTAVILRSAVMKTAIPRMAALAAGAMLLSACATMDEDNDAQDVIGSRLAQPPPGSPPVTPVDAGDIAIVGQEVAQAIQEIPAIASAPVPPMVRFTGVTSIMNQPIDTSPYTELLRDRLLLLTREKLRFVERTLPAYVPKKHHKDSDAPPSNTGGEAEYEVLAEMRGHVESDFYKIQVEFVDLRSNAVLFNQVYRIRPEAEPAPAPQEVPNPAPEPTSQPVAPSAPAAPPPPQPHDMTAPTTTAPSSPGNDTL